MRFKPRVLIFELSAYVTVLTAYIEERIDIYIKVLDDYSNDYFYFSYLCKKVTLSRCL